EFCARAAQKIARSNFWHCVSDAPKGGRHGSCKTGISPIHGGQMASHKKMPEQKPRHWRHATTGVDDEVRRSDQASAKVFSFFSGRTLTMVRAGLALKVISSPVNGLIPLRALVAGFFT